MEADVKKALDKLERKMKRLSKFVAMKPYEYAIRAGEPKAADYEVLYKGKKVRNCVAVIIDDRVPMYYSGRNHE